MEIKKETNVTVELTQNDVANIVINYLKEEKNIIIESFIIDTEIWTPQGSTKETIRIKSFVGTGTENEEFTA